MGAGRYKAGEWARLGQMGYTGAEDVGIRAAMVGGDWEGEETVKEKPSLKTLKKWVSRGGGGGLRGARTKNPLGDAFIGQNDDFTMG